MGPCCHPPLWPIQLNNVSRFITARKRSLRRLCFYRCLSVHRGVSQHALQVSRGSPGPHPGVSRPTPKGVSRPTPRGLQAHTGGDCVCILACTEADTTPHRGRLLPWVVRILLECILVACNITQYNTVRKAFLNLS